MNRATGEAVEAYRALMRAEIVRDEREQELADLVRHPELDLAAYAEATSLIEARVDEVRVAAEAAGWAPSTTRVRIVAAIHDAGRE